MQYLEVNVIDYVTIASTGNAKDFGDLSAREIWMCVASQTRGNYMFLVMNPSNT